MFTGFGVAGTTTPANILQRGKVPSTPANILRAAGTAVPPSRGTLASGAAKIALAKKKPVPKSKFAPKRRGAPAAEEQQVQEPEAAAEAAPEVPVIHHGMTYEEWMEATRRRKELERAGQVKKKDEDTETEAADSDLEGRAKEKVEDMDAPEVPTKANS